MNKKIKVIVDENVYELLPTEMNGKIYWKTSVSDDMKYVTLHWNEEAGEYIVLILSKKRRICYVYGSGSEECVGRYIYHRSTGFNDEQRPSLVAVME